MAEIIRQAIEDRLGDVHTMLPGRIDAYDPATQKADVEPLIRRLQRTVDGELKEDLPIIPGVPVVFPRAGAYKITMPVSEGDRCMLVFCESSTEAYQVGQGRKGTSALINQTDPDTFERFNLTDAVCLLGWYNDAESLTAADQDGMQLGEGSAPIIHIGNDLVELYEKGAADFVALAQKVLDELTSVQGDFDALKTAYDAHTHVVAGVVLGGPGTTSAVPIPLAPTPHTPQSVAADKVKAT